jgi:hypothetical protein
LTTINHPAPQAGSINAFTTANNAQGLYSKEPRPAVVTALNRRPTRPPENQSDDEQNQEEEEQDAGDVRGRPGYSSKPKERRHDGDYQER